MNERRDDPPRRLESWKEIAEFLDVSVRTAQAWERDRGLPVHRHPGGKRSRVFAFLHEIEAWLSPDGAIAGRPIAAGASATPEGATPRRGRRRSAWIALAALAALAALVPFVLRTGTDVPVPETCAIEGRTLAALDGEGNALWTREFPRVDPVLYRGLGPGFQCRVIDLDDDGVPEILFDARDRLRPWRGSELYCMEADGSDRWSRLPGVAVGPADPRVSGPFAMDEAVRIGDAIVSIAFHRPLYPTEVAFLDPATGVELRPPFFHPGRLYSHSLLDVDADARSELILAGKRNPGAVLGDAVLVALDLPPDGSDATVVDLFGGRSLAPALYAVFPSPCVTGVLQTGARIHRIDPIGPDVLAAKLYVDDIQVAIYRLRFPEPGVIEVLQVAIADEFRHRHRELFLSGDVDHELTGAELERLWDVRTSPYPYDRTLDLDGLLPSTAGRDLE